LESCCRATAVVELPPAIAALINARLRQDGFIHNRFKIQSYKHTEFWLQTELTAKKNKFIKNKDKFIKS
jgi:hypothetical protein